MTEYAVRQLDNFARHVKATVEKVVEYNQSGRHTHANDLLKSLVKDAYNAISKETKKTMDEEEKAAQELNAASNLPTTEEPPNDAA